MTFIEHTEHERASETLSVDDITFSKKSILIFLVDDNALYLKDLELQFSQNSDLVIRTFTTGESCLQSLSEKPDVIVLDYFLNSVTESSINGFKTLLMVKSASPKTPVIVFSGNHEAEIAVECLKEGAFDYIVKSKTTFEDLKRSIKKILGLNSKEKEMIVWDW